jgi:chromosome segregation ATPase
MLGAGEPPRSEFAPKIEEILQTVEDLKERLAEAGAEMLDLKDDLEEERSRVEELQGKLLSAQQALDEGARERRHSSSKGRSLGSQSKIERVQAVLHQRLHRSAPAGGDALPRRAPPLTAASTDGMREGTPSVQHMQAELVHKSNHTAERGRGRDTERPRVSSSRARASNSLSLEGLQGKLRSAQQATDEEARERRHSSYKGRSSSGSLGNELETIGDRFQAQVDTMYQQPFSEASTGGMREGTSTLMHMQAELPELVQTSNHNRERGVLAEAVSREISGEI